MANKEQLSHAIIQYQKVLDAMKDLVDFYRFSPALKETPPYLVFMNATTVETIKQLQESKMMCEIMLAHYDETKDMSNAEKGAFHIMKGHQLMKDTSSGAK